MVVGLAQAGDRDAFAELVRRRQSWIRNLMLRCCGDATLADDLAQQTFLHAWRNIAYLRKPSAFGAWLKRLAITQWLQHIRAADPPPLPVEEIGPESSPPNMAGIAVDLDRALAQLPPAVRLCIVLSYHERMTHAEIAQMTDLPSGTVKSHIRRGTQRLREILAAYDEPKGPEKTT